MLTEVLVVLFVESEQRREQLYSLFVCVCVCLLLCVVSDLLMVLYVQLKSEVTKPSPSPSLSACTDSLPAPLAPSSVSASALSVLWVRCSALNTPTREAQEARPALRPPSSQDFFPLHRVSPPVAAQTGDVR